MAATVFDLIGPYAIEKGFPWEFSFTRYAPPGKTPVDLTGYDCAFEIYDTQNPEAAPAVFSVATGHITLGGQDGTVSIRLAHTDTLDLVAGAARYRVVFTDSLGNARPHTRGRLGLVELDQ